MILPPLASAVPPPPESARSPARSTASNAYRRRSSAGPLPRRLRVRPPLARSDAHEWRGCTIPAISRAQTASQFCRGWVQSGRCHFSRSTWHRRSSRPTRRLQRAGAPGTPPIAWPRRKPRRRHVREAKARYSAQQGNALRYARW